MATLIHNPAFPRLWFLPPETGNKSPSLWFSPFSPFSPFLGEMGAQIFPIFPIPPLKGMGNGEWGRSSSLGTGRKAQHGEYLSSVEVINPTLPPCFSRLGRAQP